MLPSAVCLATSAAHVEFPPSGLSGTRTTAPAVSVVASATDEPATRTAAAPRGGASHLTSGSLMLDVMMLMTSSSLQPVTTRQESAPPVPQALRLGLGAVNAR